QLDLGPGRPTDFESQVAEMTPLLRGADVAYGIDLQDGRSYEETQMLAMWAGLEANCPVVNGYSARAPVDYPPRRRLLTTQTLAAWLGPDVRGTLAIIGRVADAASWMGAYRAELPGAGLERRSSG